MGEARNSHQRRGLEHPHDSRDDYLFAAKEGAIGPDHIRAELGEILIGEQVGRGSPEEITLFESLGIAVEDLAAAQFLYKRALEKDVGTRLDF